MRLLRMLRRWLERHAHAARDEGRAHNEVGHAERDAEHAGSEAGHDGDDNEADDAGNEAGLDAFNPFPEPVRLEIRDHIDLHSFQPREVRLVVEEYLREARRVGFRTVRIIHGKGIGTQREIVRGILARTPFVEHWSDAPPEAGGWGATVARLAPLTDAAEQ